MSTTPRTFAERDQFWLEYHSRRSRLTRRALGVLPYLWYRLNRWRQASAGMFVFLAFYLLALVALGALPFLTERLAQRASSHPVADGLPPATAAVASPYPAQAKSICWLLIPIAQIACGVVIAAYKSRSVGYLQSSRGEIERRSVVRDVLRRMHAHGAINPRRVDDVASIRVAVCQAIALDVRQFLQLGEHDVSVVIARVDGPTTTPEAQTLVAVARDRPTDATHWLDRARPVLQSYSYECVRLCRALVFHDVRSWQFRGFFGDAADRDYRSVFCMPLGPSGSGSAQGMIAVNASCPYVFALSRVDLDRRLQLYAELAGIFLPKGANP